jgi:hypothetical protein
MHMAAYRCPVCKKRLTKREYQSALGILEEQNVRHEHVRTELEMKLKAAERREKAAHEAGVAAEFSSVAGAFPDISSGKV